MEIFKIAAFVLCAAVFAVSLNKYTPWASMLISLAAGTVIMIYMLPQLKTLADKIKDMFALIDDGNGYAAVLLRVTAVSFIAQISSQICADAGQKALGDKIETAARIFIAVSALPLISDMLKLISDFLSVG